MRKLIFLSILLSSITSAYPFNTKCSGETLPDSAKIILMQPDGQELNGFPKMSSLDDSSSIAIKVRSNIDSSFIREVIDLYHIAQTFLYNTGQLEQTEPAYLALTTTEGGFAKKGFYYFEDSSHVNKENVPYVDITTRAALAPIDRLMSFSQLYPHEMGHVIFHMLSPEDSLQYNSFAVDMHFFSLVTDYTTAFNEGFAEHFENLARIYESNEHIRSGICRDLEEIEKNTIHPRNGFKRDIILPFRLGFYKASMLNWYQKYEDYKRYQHIVNGNIKFKNESVKAFRTEAQLSYRNAGVNINQSEIRNLVQSHSTEGVISSFFTGLTTSELANRYLPVSFYHHFLRDSTDLKYSPDSLFSPLQNQMIKYFYVLNNYVVFNHSSESQFLDFIKGYIQSFPDEAEVLKKIYEQATGHILTDSLPASIWLLVNDYHHPILVFDPFGAITLPVYTFNLNAAESEDLQTIKGVSRSEAEGIIAYREKLGFFSDIDQLKDIPGMPASVGELVISHELSKEEFEKSVSNYSSELSIKALLIKPIVSIIGKALLLFILMFLLVYWFRMRKHSYPLKRIIVLFIRYFLLWEVLVILCLAFVIFTIQPLIYSLVLLTIATGSSILIYRKKPEANLRSLLFLSLMSILLILSIL